MAMAMEVAVEDSPKKVARQRRWAVCAAKVRSGAFSSLGGDSDSESDDGVGFDGSRFKLKACMSFSGNTNLPQPEEGDDLTTQSSYTSTEGLSVDCATPVDGATTRPSPASPDLIGISLSLGQKEESPWELSSSSGESVHSTTRSQTSVQSRAVPARCERGVCPESPGSYVTRMQRTLLRIERNGASSNSHASSNNTTATNSNVNRAVGSNINGTVNGTAANSSSVDGSAINTGQDCVGTDCVGTGPAVGVLAAGGVAAGRSDVHDAESMNGSSSLPDRERQEEDKHHQEMDLMIAAIATMVGMHIPEEARYVLWLVCCAIIVLIPGRRWGLFDPTLWSSPAPSQEEEDFVEPGEEVVEDSAAGEGGGGNARVVGEASHLYTRGKRVRTSVRGYFSSLPFSELEAFPSFRSFPSLPPAALLLATRERDARVSLAEAA